MSTTLPISVNIHYTATCAVDVAATTTITVTRPLPTHFQVPFNLKIFVGRHI